MFQNPDQNELKALKDHIEALRRCESGTVPALDEIIDHEIRRRFGRMIAHTANNKTSVRETLAIVAVAR